VWDLNAQRIFSALRLKSLIPGAKNRRQALWSHTPALSPPGEGVNPLVSAFALPGEKIDSLKSTGEGVSFARIPCVQMFLLRQGLCLT
jgi:hypothetical protein